MKVTVLAFRAQFHMRRKPKFGSEHLYQTSFYFEFSLVLAAWTFNINQSCQGLVKVDFDVGCSNVADAAHCINALATQGDLNQGIKRADDLEC